MNYNPEIHHRKSIRLKDYDYSANAAYFITIITKNRDCILNDIFDGRVILSDIGKTAYANWFRQSLHNPVIFLDEFVIMPNHIHGILFLDDMFGDHSLSQDQASEGVKYNALTKPEEIAQTEDINKAYIIEEGLAPSHICDIYQEHKTDEDTLDSSHLRKGVILNAPFPLQQKNAYYKNLSPKKNSLSTIIRTYKASVTQWCKVNGFESFQWHRNFYEKIIRSEKELNYVRKYINNNPKNWEEDKLNQKLSETDNF